MAASSIESSARKPVYERQVILNQGKKDEILMVGFFVDKARAEAFNEEKANEVLDEQYSDDGFYFSKDIETDEDDFEFSEDDVKSSEDESENKDDRGMDIRTVGTPIPMTPLRALQIPHSPSKESEERQKEKMDFVMNEAHLFTQIHESDTYCVFEKGEQPQIIFKHLGNSLKDFMEGEEEGEELTPLQRIEGMISIVEAFEKIYEKGYLHCDIKSRNIVVQKKDKKLGFNFCDVEDLWDLKNPPEKFDMRGTPLCRAPELQQEGDTVPSLKTEIYSLAFAFSSLLGCEVDSDENEELSVEFMHRSQENTVFKFLEEHVHFEEIQKSYPDSLGIRESIKLLKDMTSEDPEARPSLPELKQRLEAIKNIIKEENKKPHEDLKSFFNHRCTEEPFSFDASELVFSSSS